jgi:hypothetical protein
MIRYSLVCPEGHDFEAWFAGSEAYEKQRAGGTVACPVCGSTSVDKALMAPAVSTSRKKESMRLAANMPAGAEPEPKAVAAMLRKLRDHLTANAENVGPRFAEEARKIHYNEAEKRGIYGEASPDEARALAEEGIEFHPLPMLPEEHN